jgi:DNA-binding NtrC family response regulator
VAAEEIGLLQAYSWPGNVRELSAVIERAAILGGGTRLDIARALGVVGPSLPSPAAPVRPVTEGLPQRATTVPVLPLDAAMARHIETALTRCRGQIEGRYGAAALLRINPHTLRARMRKLKIDWQRFRDPEPASLGDESPTA